MPKLGTKISFFDYFWARIFKAIVIFEISKLKFVKSQCLTHTVSFGIEFAFSKGPGSIFSESPGPGLGLLYKVYLFFVHSTCFQIAFLTPQE